MGDEQGTAQGRIARALMQHRIYDSPVTNWWRCAGCRQDVGTRSEAERHQADAVIDALGLEPKPCEGWVRYDGADVTFHEPCGTPCSRASVPAERGETDV